MHAFHLFIHLHQRIVIQICQTIVHLWQRWLIWWGDPMCQWMLLPWWLPSPDWLKTLTPVCASEIGPLSCYVYQSANWREYTFKTAQQIETSCFGLKLAQVDLRRNQRNGHIPVFPQVASTCCSNALWVKLCWKVVIGKFTKMIPSGPIFLNLNYFRQNIWRLSSVQFHFWYILGD